MVVTIYLMVIIVIDSLLLGSVRKNILLCNIIHVNQPTALARSNITFDDK